MTALAVSRLISIHATVPINGGSAHAEDPFDRELEITRTSLREDKIELARIRLEIRSAVEKGLEPGRDLELQREYYERVIHFQLIAIDAINSRNPSAYW